MRPGVRTSRVGDLPVGLGRLFRLEVVPLLSEFFSPGSAASVSVGSGGWVSVGCRDGESETSTEGQLPPLRPPTYDECSRRARQRKGTTRAHELPAEGTSEGKHRPDRRLPCAWEGRNSNVYGSASLAPICRGWSGWTDGSPSSLGRPSCYRRCSPCCASADSSMVSPLPESRSARFGAEWEGNS